MRELTIPKSFEKTFRAYHYFVLKVDKGKRVKNEVMARGQYFCYFVVFNANIASICTYVSACHAYHTNCDEAYIYIYIYIYQVSQ